jgi:hypothetical protein
MAIVEPESGGIHQHCPVVCVSTLEKVFNLFLQPKSAMQCEATYYFVQPGNSHKLKLKVPSAADDVLKLNNKTTTHKVWKLL